MPGRTSVIDTMALHREMLDVLKPDQAQTAMEITMALDGRGYTFDKNTIRRNLLKLESTGSVVVETPEDNVSKRTADGAHLYRLAGKGHMNPVALRLVDALSLKLVESTLTHLLPAQLVRQMKPTFAHATQKLTFLEKMNPNARWPNLVAAIPRNFELAPPKIDPKILETVQEALLSGEQIEIDYKSLQDTQHVVRRLSPHALLHKGQVTYLIATQVNKHSPRTYALHRMKGAKGTGARAVSSGFDLHDYLASEGHEPGTNAAIQLDARINGNLSKILNETPLNKTMKIKREAGGSSHITATVRDNQALYRWILGHGAAIEVLGPPTLRKSIADTVRAATRHYEN